MTTITKITIVPSNTKLPKTSVSGTIERDAVEFTYKENTYTLRIGGEHWAYNQNGSAVWLIGEMLTLKSFWVSIPLISFC